MKVITDYFSLKHHDKPTEEVDDSDEGEVYYEARRIRIRLADPNVRDSYVCEIYDTSTEDIMIEEASKPETTQTPKNSQRFKRTRQITKEQCDSSSEDDETLSSVKKRLRETVQARLKSEDVRKKSENILRPPNINRNTRRSKNGIGDYFLKQTLKPGSVLNKKNLENVKSDVPLAPVFRKSVRKPKDDPAVLKARRDFLHSGLPNKMRKKVDKLKAETGIDVPFFPTVSHVQQMSDELVWKKRFVDLKLKDIDAYEDRPLIWKTRQCSRKMPIPDIKPQRTAAIDLPKLKKAYKNVDVDACYRELKKKFEEEEGFLAWPDKYQPISSDVLANDNSVKKLSNWLTSWKRFSESTRDECTASDSSHDFLSSDEENLDRKPPLKVCLLQGPVGCGKTAVVRALASEMDFKILEINSSSKRSGKKMLTDLQEATKSHKILQEKNSNKYAMSVIVVEEADVVFEQDEGFVSGLQTLITTAKRPLLMLTNDASASHLEKFRTRHTLQLTMKRPPLHFACVILELISLMEGASPPRSLLSEFLNVNKFDLRKCIYELQFWVQNSKVVLWDNLRCQSITPTSVWWGEKCETKPPTKDFEHFDHLSVLDVITGRTFDRIPHHLNKGIIKDSCCLSENRDEFDEMTVLKEEIASEILKLTNKFTKMCSITPTKIRYHKTNEIRAMDELLQLVPKTSNKHKMYVDFLPILRDICRNEKENHLVNGKRGNRFSHYFQSIGLKPTQNNLDINCQALTASLD